MSGHVLLMVYVTKHPLKFMVTLITKCPVSQHQVLHLVLYVCQLCNSVWIKQIQNIHSKK